MECSLIELVPHKLGTILPVRAQPGARCDEIRGELGGALKVAVTQVAEKGKANKSIQVLLAKHFQIARSQVVLLSGETSSAKKFLHAFLC